MTTELQPGDRVGIKDAPEFLHWSFFGTVQAGMVQAGTFQAGTGDGAAVLVLADGAAEARPMLPGVLVKLGPDGEQNAWNAQCFPVGGDAPGPIMYFANHADAMEFVSEFGREKLSDERLHVHPGSAATPAELAVLKDESVIIV
jgi:hypothetical protein